MGKIIHLDKPLLSEALSCGVHCHQPKHDNTQPGWTQEMQAQGSTGSFPMFSLPAPRAAAAQRWAWTSFSALWRKETA